MEQNISHIAYRVRPQEPTQEPGLGELTVTKVVTGDQAPDKATYELNVAGPDGYSEDVELSINGTGSDSEALTDLEPGEYTVAESDIPGGPAVTLDPADGKVIVGPDDDPAVSVTVTNDYGDAEEPDLGQLTVTKDVEGDQAPNGRTDYVLNVGGPDGYSEDVTLSVNGEGSDSETLTDLEPGEYTVTESDIPGEPAVNLDPADGKVMVGADDDPTVSVTVTNNYDDGTEVESTWPLTIVKNVAGPIPDNEFTFTVDCVDFTLGEQNKSFTIDPEGGTQLIGIEIPEGTECTVTETGDADAAETTVTINDGEPVNSEPTVTETIDEATTVTFLNTFSPADTGGEPTAPLIVEKDVRGPASGEDFAFAIECDGFGVGNDAAFSIDGDGGTHTTGTSIPEGTECTVTETDDAGADRTTVTVNDGDPMVGEDSVTFATTDEATTVGFRNMFNEKPDETEVEDEDLTPPDEDPVNENPTNPQTNDPAENADVTEVAAETLVAVEEDDGTIPTRIDAGGGGLATSQGPMMGLTALVALMGGLFLALTRRSHRDQTV